MTKQTASLPMYNLPEMARRNAAFWKALSEEICADGFARPPVELSFDRPSVPDAGGKAMNERILIRNGNIITVHPYI